ncbi:MAG: hypothetical protein ACODAJ_03635 [Planctomycetota bacterium]
MTRTIRFVAAILLLGAAAEADRVELLNGTRVEGRIVSETAEGVTIKVTTGDSAAEMRFPLSRVHAITTDGHRRIINEKAACSTARPAPPSSGRKPPSGTERPKPGGRRTRTRAEVEALIQQAGTTPPGWWEEVPLEYPQSLDLSWPDRPQGPWNAQKNVGQYIWSVINENPHKWRSGVRFLHHMLIVQKDNPAKLGKVMDALAGAYFRLLDDYARAAFWWRMAARRREPSVRVTLQLAECYWRLGSKAMAVEELRKVRRYVTPMGVKLWAEMGELKRALAMARVCARYDRLAPAAVMNAGDACRLHGRYREAVAWYRKALAIPATGKRKQHMEKVHGRARASIEAVKVYDALDLSRVADGTHRATVMSYAGPITVEVTVQGGRITALKPTRHRDKQTYGALTEVPRQIIEAQGLKGVDAAGRGRLVGVRSDLQQLRPGLPHGRHPRPAAR